MLTRLVIRNLDLGPGVVVSPMVGITDLPFRKMCRSFGADLVFCEMVASPALALTRRGRVNLQSLRMLRKDPSERPFAVQLFGSSPEALHVGAQVAAENGADLIDLNMGCPTRRVAGGGSGSGLLRDPEHARKCIAAVRCAIPDLPFTVKMRAGWDEQHVTGVEIAKIAEAEGAEAITMHGRLRSHSYLTPANWDYIAQVVQAVKVPVIGNGDIWTAQDALRMARQTGCSGVMLARGVRGNPWLIREARAALSETEPPPPPTSLEKLEVLLSFWRGLKDFRGLGYAIKDIRKHIIWFSKGIPGAAELRREIPAFLDEETLVARVSAFFQNAADQF